MILARPSGPIWYSFPFQSAPVTVAARLPAAASGWPAKGGSGSPTTLTFPKPTIPLTGSVVVAGNVVVVVLSDVVVGIVVVSGGAMVVVG